MSRGQLKSNVETNEWAMNRSMAAVAGHFHVIHCAGSMMTAGVASQVQIHLDVKSEWSVGCHWGTLRQKAHEHIMEPPTALEAELRRRSIDQGSFQVT